MEDLNQQIGRLEAQVEELQRQMLEMRQDIKCLSNLMTKWKGAGAVLLILGACFGWIADLATKYFK